MYTMQLFRQRTILLAGRGREEQYAIAIVLNVVYCITLTRTLSPRHCRCGFGFCIANMAEATAADGQMKDLKISETKKSKKDGAPKKAEKKPQQQKKKVRLGRSVSRPVDKH
jgi:hypothetical protein